MKPTFETLSENQRETASRRFPVTDYNYQSVALDDYKGRCTKSVPPSFLNISRDYFEKEAPHTFVGEAAFFAMIVITSTLPVLNSAHAIADFIRAIGAV